MSYWKRKSNCVTAAFSFRSSLQNGTSIQSSGDLRSLCQEEWLEQAIRAADALDQQGIPILRDNIYYLLQGCTRKRDLISGRRVYSLMVSSGLDSINILGDHLIRMFTSCGSLVEANDVFQKVSSPSIYTWNSIISAHVKLGENEGAIKLYHRMQDGALLPDKVTLSCILKACSGMGAVGQGRLIHLQVIESKLESDVVVGSALIEMYAKAGYIEEARRVFDKLLNRDIVSWGAMISGYAALGQGGFALDLYGKMQQQGIYPNKLIFSSIMKACGSLETVGQGQLIYGQIIREQLESDVFIGSAVVDMYGKCGCLEEAQRVFDKLPHHDVVLWGALISGYAQHGHFLCSLQLFEGMQHKGIKPGKALFLCALKACGCIGAIRQGRLIHNVIIKDGLELEVVLGNTLVDMYAKSGSLQEAHKLFGDLLNRDVVSWGALIAGYIQQEDVTSALELFEKMQVEIVKPSDMILSCILKAFGIIEAVGQGRVIHAQIIRVGLESDGVIGSTLVDMYAKCGILEDASRIFDRLLDRDVFSWSAMISGYAHHGHGFFALELFKKMQQEDVVPDKVIFLCIVNTCSSMGALQQGRLVHEQTIRSGFESDSVVGNKLLDMYTNCRSMEDACKVFDSLRDRDVGSWAEMVSAYAQDGDNLRALELFHAMQQKDIKPNKLIFVCILKACGSIGALGQGILIHNQLIKSGLDADLVVVNALIDMYAKCGSLQLARKVFDKLLNRDVVTWGAMIAGYACNGHGFHALELFDKMQQEEVSANKVIHLCILKICASMRAVCLGRSVHGEIINVGLESDVVVGNTLVDMYAKCSSLEEAHCVFDKLSNKNVVSWGVMITGFVQNGDSLTALEIFENMCQEGIEPSKTIFLSLLKACGSIGAIRQGRLIHSRITVIGLESDMLISSTVIDMYAKCGKLNEAYQIFVELPSPDVVSWGAMTAGYALYSNFEMARQCLEDMQQQGLKSDDVIITSILAACSHAGLLEEGHRILKSFQEDYGKLSVEHRNCMIDLFCRTGHLEAAEDLIHSMPFPPDIKGWRSLLAGCRTHSNMDLGRRCFDHVIQLEPDDASAYMLMSHTCANMHMYEDAHTLQEVRKYGGALKKPGKAWIEIDNDVHEFIVGSKSHPESSNVSVKFERLNSSMRTKGYVPQLDSVLTQSQVNESNMVF